MRGVSSIGVSWSGSYVASVLGCVWVFGSLLLGWVVFGGCALGA